MTAVTRYFPCVTDEESLADMVWANAERFGGTIGFRRRTGGSWLDVTTREFATHVHDVAKGMIAAGLRPGDRVALLSGTRYEWSLFDFASWSVGCHTVPISATATASEVEWILSDSGAAAVVVETDAHRDLVRRVVDRLPELGFVWQLTGKLTAVDELTALGADVDDESARACRLAVGTDDIATLVYPPGEHPKRVELTHGELLSDVRGTIGAFPHLLRAGNSLLVLLQLADMPARIISLCCVYTRTTLGHVPNTDDLFTDLGVFRPRVIVAGAGLLREVHTSARHKAHAEGNTAVFDAAEAVAVAFGATRGTPSLALRVKHAVANKIVYPKLRAAFGGRCVAAITSGELEPDRISFFRGIGIDVHDLATTLDLPLR